MSAKILLLPSKCGLIFFNLYNGIAELMQRELIMITLRGAIEKSPIFLSQYWKNELLDGTIIISYYGGSNNDINLL